MKQQQLTIVFRDTSRSAIKFLSNEYDWVVETYVLKIDRISELRDTLIIPYGIIDTVKIQDIA